MTFRFHHVSRLMPPLLAAALITASPAHAGTIIFDNFNDNSLNTALWLPATPIGGGSVREVNQRLEVTAARGGSAVVAALLATLSGDFDVRVGYELNGLLNPIYETGAGIFLLTPTSSFTVGRDTVDGPEACGDWGAPCNGYVGGFPYPESEPNEFKVRTMDVRGALRFTRAGNKTAALYGPSVWSDAWSVIYETTDFPVEPITGVYIGVVTWGEEDVWAAFDDFRLEADTVTPIPEPGSLLLLGTGVLGLARAVRTRRGRR